MISCLRLFLPSRIDLMSQEGDPYPVSCSDLMPQEDYLGPEIAHGSSGRASGSRPESGSFPLSQARLLEETATQGFGAPAAISR